MTRRLFLVAAVFLTGITPTVALAQPAGQKLFQQRCSACHSVETGKTRIGPSLAGIVGRKAGSNAGFAYSAALKGYGQSWTKATLDRFLAAPQKIAPGTRMVLAVPSADDRAAVIAYLSGLK